MPIFNSAYSFFMVVKSRLCDEYYTNIDLSLRNLTKLVVCLDVLSIWKTNLWPSLMSRICWDVVLMFPLNLISWGFNLCSKLNKSHVNQHNAVKTQSNSQFGWCSWVCKLNCFPPNGDDGHHGQTFKFLFYQTTEHVLKIRLFFPVCTTEL